MRKATDFEKKVFAYLNDLRSSSVTNMFGAGPYVERSFGVDKSEAMRLVKLWMNNFSEEGDYEEIKE